MKQAGIFSVCLRLLLFLNSSLISFSQCFYFYFGALCSVSAGVRDLRLIVFGLSPGERKRGAERRGAARRGGGLAEIGVGSSGHRRGVSEQICKRSPSPWRPLADRTHPYHKCSPPPPITGTDHFCPPPHPKQLTEDNQYFMHSHDRGNVGRPRLEWQRRKDSITTPSCDTSN